MPELHARGVELVVELLDAADNVHKLKPDDLANLQSIARDSDGTWRSVEARHFASACGRQAEQAKNFRRRLGSWQIRPSQSRAHQLSVGLTLGDR